MRSNLSELFQLPSEKGSTIKGKNLLPFGANSFLLELNSLKKGWCARKQTGSQIICLPCEKWRKLYEVYLFPIRCT